MVQPTTWDEAPRFEPFEGVDIRIIGNGMHATMCYIVIGPGAVVDWHAHPHEQMGTLISGAGELSTRDRVVKAKPGAAWFLSPHEEHKFVTKGDEPAIIIETFAPARTDYVIKAK
jgi:quercetin dioxygenase-like cupin family protein